MKFLILLWHLLTRCTRGKHGAYESFTDGKITIFIRIHCLKCVDPSHFSKGDPYAIDRFYS